MLALYTLLLPVIFLVAFPGWIIKMIKRGGFGTSLGERLAIYTRPKSREPNGAVHIHAISVGESLLALKLIRAWQARDPSQRFVLAVGTATGHAVATSAGISELRVTYSPLDFPCMVRRYLNRFRPTRVVLIEAEIWPQFMRLCRKSSIPVSLVNARMSPRSARRMRRFARHLQPFYSLLDAVCIQQPDDREIWHALGVANERIHLTGSIKFDPGSGTAPTRRPDFQQILDAFGKSRPVVLAASTHAGEDAAIARAIREASPDALPVLVPRHAERREEVRRELEQAGFSVTLRSAFSPDSAASDLLVIDSTGELRDWTAHADVAIIGKSFLSTGGQNPCEAILSDVPVIIGPHMENFEPLASRLVAAGAAIRSETNSLPAAIRNALEPEKAADLTTKARQLLTPHQGATNRTLDLLIGKP